MSSFIWRRRPPTTSVSHRRTKRRARRSISCSCRRFTNSVQQRVGFGVGIGYALNVSEATAAGSEGIAAGSGLITANWLFNIYRRRPLLVEPIKPRLGSRYRISLAVTLGTNLNVFELEQLILGLTVGHLFGRHGLLVGVNFIAPRESGTRESEAVPYAAFAFNF